ncbi:capsular polysaccharide biosynthesis protein [Rahnella woolbedingensis]|uniref:Capsular polysaccharide biosynthesis protein n=1 Tax=Rahnella woolbedingensis TaxID=1510574 RepID=A0A419NDS2_9GAMM|nr:capsular polysaccharide biosynthesis protein [Rahnella woolbedingensis]RJT46758.1 capsular polysaccharide biosynthesis protein [Rahnella woolbedingensis]
MIGIFSAGIHRIPHLETFLGQPCRKLSLLRPVPEDITQIAVWGYRPTGDKAVALAKKSGLPVLRLEDGFIRSLELGVTGAAPLSMVLDTEGMYYDASQPSTLERLIHQREENPLLHDAARQAMQMIVEGDLSKYNQAPACTLARPKQGAVLVVDQTFGDMAVVYGNAGAQQFDDMLRAAIAENPQSEIWVKIHPDVLHGKKAGYFTQIAKLAQQEPRIKLLAENVSPQSLLRLVEHVYVVTSNYGFEALIAGKPVSVFGQPWYAGWGITDDRHAQAEPLRARRGTASLEDLFSAACLRYSRYINPVNGKNGTLFDVLSWLAMQRRHHQQRAGRLWTPGLTLWKRSILAPFVRTKSNKVNFSKRYAGETACVVWGIKGEARWGAQTAQHQIPQWCMEDGFLRSAGLGSDLHPPLSLVLDKSGIYYDATRPSDLEQLLNNSTLTAFEQQRAAALRQRLVASKVSKYNLGAAFTLPVDAAGKTVILVPGQVEDDASILTGTLSLCTNGDLLRTVRERNPDAYIIYKPHPDVLVGNRQGHIPAQDVSRWADSQALDADIIQCIQAADELHTLTSLSGFEALLHGKKVACYGMPFYAGWGLTQDEHSCSRRLRSLSLDDVVYQALIAYPSYIDPQSREPILAEQAVELLAATPRAEMQFTRIKAGRIVRYYRKLLMLIRVTLST